MSCFMMPLKLLLTIRAMKVMITFGNVELEDDLNIQINVFFCEIQSFHPIISSFPVFLNIWFGLLKDLFILTQETQEEEFKEQED